MQVGGKFISRNVEKIVISHCRMTQTIENEL